MDKCIEAFNPSAGGLCKTIKAQYFKNSLANFIHPGGYGATAVIEIVYINDRNE
jgi:hypothetical protein